MFRWSAAVPYVQSTLLGKKLNEDLNARQWHHEGIFILPTSVVIQHPESRTCVLNKHMGH